MNKSIEDIVKNLQSPDIIAFYETKAHNKNVCFVENELKSLGYSSIYSTLSVERKSYAGVTVAVKQVNTSKLIDLPDFVNNKTEYSGRIIGLEFSETIIVFSYSMNSGRDLKRLDLRTQQFDKDLFQFISELQQVKPVILTGDLNIIIDERDIWNPKKNVRLAGFTVEERMSFQNRNHSIIFPLIDSFREKHGEKIKYSYFSLMRKDNRIKNRGFRLDYFFVDIRLKDNIINSDIINNLLIESDHDPIVLELTKI